MTPSKTRSKRQRVKRVLAVYFVLVTLAMIWPIYPLASRVEPFVFGMPFSLAYLVLLLTLSFLVLLFCYLYERLEED